MRGSETKEAFVSEAGRPKVKTASQANVISLDGELRKLPRSSTGGALTIERVVGALR